MLSPNLPFSIPHYLSYGKCESGRTVHCQREEGGGWVDSEFTDLHCVLEESHI